MYLYIYIICICMCMCVLVKTRQTHSHWPAALRLMLRDAVACTVAIDLLASTTRFTTMTPPTHAPHKRKEELALVGMAHQMQCGATRWGAATAVDSHIFQGNVPHEVQRPSVMYRCESKDANKLAWKRAHTNTYTVTITRILATEYVHGTLCMCVCVRQQFYAFTIPLLSFSVLFIAPSAKCMWL